MQKQRVDISKGLAFQSTICFESYRYMFTPWTNEPDAGASTFWTMQEEYNHTIM